MYVCTRTCLYILAFMNISLHIGGHVMSVYICKLYECVHLDTYISRHTSFCIVLNIFSVVSLY